MTSSNRSYSRGGNKVSSRAWNEVSRADSNEVSNEVSNDVSSEREEAAIELAKAKLTSFSKADEAVIRSGCGPDLLGLIVALGRAKDEEARTILNQFSARLRG